MMTIKGPLRLASRRPGVLADRRGAAMLEFAKLRADRKGAVVVEFALCSTAFFGLLIASLQIALVYFAQQAVQTSAEAMARRIMTGEIRQGNTSAQQFRQAACATLPSYMDCAKLVVDARQATSFAGVDMSMPQLTYDGSGNVTGGLQYDTGTGDSIVVLRMMYQWHVSTGPLGFDISNQGTNGGRLLIGTMVFKSERFAS